MQIRNLLFAIVALGAGGMIAPTPADAGSYVSFGVSIGTRLPHGAVRVYVGHDPYYFYRGSYYRHYRRGYVLVPAPRGAFIRELPRGYVRVVRGPVVYFRFGGVFYREIRGGYEVCDAPVDVVESGPPPPANDDKYADYLPVWKGDDQYLFKDGQFFRKSPDGLVWQEPPLGAISEHLPPDAISIWYQDREYFESKGAFFQEVHDGFKVVEKPFPADASAGKDG